MCGLSNSDRDLIKAHVGDVDVLAVDGGAELLLVVLLAVQAAPHHLLLCPRVLCHPSLQPQHVTHSTLSPQGLDTSDRALKVLTW